MNDFLPPRTAATGADVARDVLVEAFGASATPFVPLPFVDDFLLARLLRRIATKTLGRHGLGSPTLSKSIVGAYVKEGASSFGATIAVGVARFVVRKVAIVLDVKKSYDVFGESIIFALALDVAAEHGWVHDATASRVGAAIHRAREAVGYGTVEALVRAVREAAGGGGPTVAFGAAVGAEIAKIRLQLQPLLRRDLP